jgi:hypothetical protein
MPARITLTERSRWDFGSQTRCGLYLTHSAPGVNSIHGANRHRLDWGSDAKSRWPPALLMLQSQRNGGAPQLVAEVVFSGEGLERGKARCNPLTKLPLSDVPIQRPSCSSRQINALIRSARCRWIRRTQQARSYTMAEPTTSARNLVGRNFKLTRSDTSGRTQRNKASCRKRRKIQFAA